MCNLSEGIWEKGLAKGKAEGIAEGMAKGKAEGMAKGIAQGMAKGKAEGMAKGMAKGKAEGMAEGIAKGKAEGISKGQLLQLAHDVEMLLSNEITFDNAVKWLNIPPDSADKIKEIINK